MGKRGYINKSFFIKYYESLPKNNNDTWILEKIKPKVAQKYDIDNDLKYNGNMSFTPIASDNNELNDLYKSSEYTGYNDSFKISIYEDTYNNEEEYIYSLFNIILNCKVHFIIKKCELC